MASSQFTDMAAMGETDMAAMGRIESKKSQPSPSRSPFYGYDQSYSSNNPTSYGYNQPGDKDPIPPPGFRQPGYGYGHPARAPTSENNVEVIPRPFIVVAQVPEYGPPPDTTIGLVLSILVTIFCFLPIGTAAIIYNIMARYFVDVGRYARARVSLTYMWVYIGSALLVGLGIWGYMCYAIVQSYKDN